MVEYTNILSVLATQPMLAEASIGGGEGGFPWLTLTTFGPLIGILALMFIPRDQVQVLRNVALLTTLGVFCVSLGILLNFDPSYVDEATRAFSFQLEHGPYEWIPALGIEYYVGVDGFSIWLVMLTTFLMPIAVWSTYSAITENVKEYMICLLFLQVGMIGALVALDVFLFYIFWEVMLIPMYLIIGVWGADDRIKAAIKFFLYTMLGSVLMLVAILYVYLTVGAGDGGYSFLYTNLIGAEFTLTEQMWLFGAFLLAFAIKVPLFPFHTWLPLAHVQAPTAGSVILAAVMLKLGTYGLIRYAFPLFPDALVVYAPYIAVLSVIGIVYGALLALAQDNVKSLVAYSSVSHLGFCVLGLVAMTPQGLAGGMYVMLAHGIATGGLFLCVGMLYERRHSKMIKDFGGVAKVMPVFAAFFGIIMLGSAALPGLAGFVGEFLSLLGTSKSHFLSFGEYLFFPAVTETFSAWPEGFSSPAGSDGLIADGSASPPIGPEVTAFAFTTVAALGVILGAAYLLWMFKRVMFGEVTDDKVRNMPGLSGREIGVLLPIVFMIIFMGVYPKFFLSYMDNSFEEFLGYMDNQITVTEEFDEDLLREVDGQFPERSIQSLHDIDTDQLEGEIDDVLFQRLQEELDGVIYGSVVVEPLADDWTPEGSILDRALNNPPRDD